CSNAPLDTQVIICVFFFFQAEDGIRDWSVTGVQTCALPIWDMRQARASSSLSNTHAGPRPTPYTREPPCLLWRLLCRAPRVENQIGRASCRERVEMSVGGGWL